MLMVTGRRRHLLVLISSAFALVGCSGDGEKLDRFSRAYTEFLNVSGETRVASIVIVFNDEKQSNYWAELRGAMDDHASSKARLQHAVAAMRAETETIDSRFEAFNIAFEKLDRAVAQLVEIASSMGSREYREEATGVSQRAREVHAAYASRDRLYVEAFGIRRKVLAGIVAEHGGYVPVLTGLSREAERNRAIVDEQKTVDRQLASAEAGLKDAFSTLAGRAGLTKYPSKWDDPPQK